MKYSFEIKQFFTSNTFIKNCCFFVRNISSVILLLLLIQSCKPKVKTETVNKEKTETTINEESNILFWSQSEREDRFRKIPEYMTSTTVKPSSSVRELPQGIPLEFDIEIDGKKTSLEEYMTTQNTMGIVVLKDGKIRLEKYRSQADGNTHWISFSVTKSITSTLVGAAILDGYITSIEDPITKYIPELKGSGYDGVLIKHIMTMTSGVQWNEDYTDPEADVSKMQAVQPKKGESPVVAYMKTLKSTSKPGEKWNYNTGETNLIGVLVTKATGKTLSAYLTEKIWMPYGMEQEASWALNANVEEYGGCCISTSVKDFARFGQFVLEEMKVEKPRVVPKNWFQEAGKAQVNFDKENGYGYQWWTYGNGTFGARGIFGQEIFIDSSRNLIIAINSNFVSAVDPKSNQLRVTLRKTIQKAIDAEKQN